MSEKRFVPYDSPQHSQPDQLSNFREGVQRYAPQIAAGVGGGAGIATLTVLVTAGMAPLLVGAGATAATTASAKVLGDWLQSLGANALADWLGDWSARETQGFLRFLLRILFRKRPDEGATVQKLARALQGQIDSDAAISEDVARLLEETGALSSAVEALPTSEEQEKLLQALRQDLVRYQTEQGRLHQVLMSEISQLEERLTAKVEEVHDAVRALQPAQQLIVEYAEFFRPWLDENRRIHHLFPLVGRRNEFQALENFARSATHRVAIFPGPGGIGKSRLLQSFAQAYEAGADNGVGGAEGTQAATLRFISAGVEIDQAALNQVPTESCLLVLDDAHLRTPGELHALFHLAVTRETTIKLLLTCRPQSVDELRTHLTRIGFDDTQILQFPSLQPLPIADARKLAREILGAEYESYADRLARVTWDSPLITVVGGRLLVEKRIPPELLADDQQFRRIVLDYFRNEVIGKVSDQIEPQLCRRLLELIAALSPVQHNNERLLAIMSEFLGIDAPQLNRFLGILESAGVLRRRGYGLRIVPDVLSDYLLHDACLNEQGLPTGYAEHTFEHFRALRAGQLLKNIGEVDWRVMHVGGGATNLLEPIWQMLEAEFEASSDARRWRILHMVQDVAYLQPAQVLRLVERAMRPSPVEEDGDGLPQLPGYVDLYRNHDDVLRLLPGLLEHIAYDLQLLPRCCDLLWELGKDDNRFLDATPRHAMKVLAELSRYRVGQRELRLNGLVLEAVERWCRIPGTHEHAHSPLDVVDPLLEKSGYSDHFEGSTVIMQPFLVHPEHAQPLRERVLRLVMEAASSTNLKIAMRGLQSINKALRLPTGYPGLNITKQFREQWQPEGLRILEFVADLVKPDTHPLMLIRIVETVRPLANRAHGTAISQKAEEILARVGGSYELRLARAVVYSPATAWAPERLWASGDEGTWKRHLQAEDETLRSLAEEFVAHNPDTHVGTAVLAELLHDALTYGFQPLPTAFLLALAQVNPDYAAKLCETMFDMPVGPLTPHALTLLFGVRTQDPPRALLLAKKVVDGGDSLLCAALAGEYANNRGDWNATASWDDVEILRMLAAHPEPLVRQHTLTALGQLGSARGLRAVETEAVPLAPDISTEGIPATSQGMSDTTGGESTPGAPDIVRAAIDIALNTDLGGYSELADELCRIFDRSFGIPLDALTEEDIAKVLAKLTEVTSLKGYFLNNFLVNLSKQQPEEVARMLIARVEKALQREQVEVRTIEEDEVESATHAEEAAEDNGAVAGARDATDAPRQFEPLPLLGFDHPLLGIVESVEYESILHQVRDLALSSGKSDRLWLTRLFKEISLGFSDRSLAVLAEWIDTGDPQRLEAVSRLLIDAPDSFPFAQEEFCVNLLDKANDAGPECYRLVKDRLYQVAFSVELEGIVGEPYPQMVALQEQAQEAMSRYAPGSPGYRFYRELHTGAQRSNEHQRLLDEELELD